VLGILDVLRTSKIPNTPLYRENIKEKTMKIIKTTGILIGLVIVAGIALFGLIQLVPYGHDHTNPPVVKEPTWDAQTRAIAQKACFDCHSNEVVWPWYSNIAPFSWLIQHDVEEGRSRLNFSDWGRWETGEIGEVVAEGEMPPGQYLIMHPAADLTDAEKQALIQAFGR
jgi:cytochrome c551/c552